MDLNLSVRFASTPSARFYSSLRSDSSPPEHTRGAGVPPLTVRQSPVSAFDFSCQSHAAVAFTAPPAAFRDKSGVEIRTREKPHDNSDYVRFCVSEEGARLLGGGMSVRDESGDPPANVATAAAAYPRLASTSPPLLPLPTNLIPLFTPLGATVPLPVFPQRPRQRRRAAPAQNASRRTAAARPHNTAPEAQARSTAAVGPAAAAAAAEAQPAGHRRVPPRRTIHRDSPGVYFCDYALKNFHLLVVPATQSRVADPEARIWILHAHSGKGTQNMFLVRNALNFCFSMPPHRFVVKEVGDCIFSSVVANANIARYIVAFGHCKLGKTSLLLFPSLDSAIAAAKQRSEGKIRGVSIKTTDVTTLFEFQTCATGQRASLGTHDSRPIQLVPPSLERPTPPLPTPEKQVSNSNATIDGAARHDLPAFSNSINSGSDNDSEVHLPLNSEPSHHAPNGCQFQEFITPAHPFANRPYLQALLSATPAPRKTADEKRRLRRARSLSPPQTRCYRCLASDHLIAACRDPIRCRGCLRNGHRSQDCSKAGSISCTLWPRSAGRSSSKEHTRSPPRHAAPSTFVERSDRRPPTFDQRVGSTTVTTPPSPPNRYRSRSPPARLGGSPVLPALDAIEGRHATRSQPRSSLPSLGDLLAEEEHEVSARRRRARRKRDVDSASKKRRSVRLAAKESAFYIDATTKATSIKAAKLDLKGASALMADALEASGILARPPPARTPLKHLRRLGRVCGLQRLCALDGEEPAAV
ncbi:unnamed protein product [Urochloa humidicola]